MAESTRRQQGPLEIAADGTHFVRDGEPLFVLADTVWTAFNNVAEHEWDEYLDLRRAQGFNALQISPTGIPAASGDWSTHRYPFRYLGGREFDYASLDAAYFERAAGMLRAAVERGFIPMLILVWQHHVAGTSWSRRNDPARSMTHAELSAYVERLADVARHIRPVILVSGDTDFEDSECIAFHAHALDEVVRHFPGAIATLHVKSGYTSWPSRLQDDPRLHFYMFQSGHYGGERASDAWRLARSFAGQSPRRPIFNGEPAYEGHGCFNVPRTISRFDTRRAIWQSLLAGASAGTAYGAAGVWSWHRPGDPFMRRDQIGEPLCWRDALRLPGAADAGFARWVFETHNLTAAAGVDGVVSSSAGSPDEIRVAHTVADDRVAIYAPYNYHFEVALDRGARDWWMIDLESRAVSIPDHTVTADGVAFAPRRHNGDVVIIG